MKNRSYLLFLPLLLFPAVALFAQRPPQDPALRVLELYRAGNCKDAVPLMEEILRRQPRNMSIRTLLDRCRVELGETQPARTQAAPAPDDTAATPPGQPAAGTQTPGSATGESGGPPEAPAPPPVDPDLARALQLIDAGNFQEAVGPLQRLVERSPNLEEPRLRLAETYSRLRQFTNAAAQYQILAERPGAPPDRLLRLAQNQTWDQNYPGAIANYRAYLSRRPDDAEARLGLANALAWSGKPLDAVPVYRAYLAANPASREARLSLANALLWSEKWSDALSEFREVKKFSQNDTTVGLAIGQCLEGLEQLEQAQEEYEAVLRIDPANREAQTARRRMVETRTQRRVTSLVEQRQFDTAADVLLDYLETEPESAETVLQIARVLSWGERFRESSRYYREYLDKKPNDAAALRELGLVQLSIPDLAGARETYARLTSARQPLKEDLEGLIKAWTWEGRYDGAQSAARQLLAMDPGNRLATEARQGLYRQEKQRTLENARSLSEAGRYGEAYDLLRDVADRFGADRQVELDMARMLAWNKQPEKAIAAYRDYLQRYPEDRAAQLDLGDLLRWEDEAEAARQSYARVLEVDPENARALLGLAQLADQSGVSRQNVAAAYRRVLEFQPDNSTARTRLEELTPAIAPSAGYSQRAFFDSDGFGRSTNLFEGGVPMGGGVHLGAFYRYDYLSQQRQVGGAACGASSAITDPVLTNLSRRICDSDGIVRAQGGGLRVSVEPNPSVLFQAELATLRFDTGRSGVQASAELQYRPGQGRVLSFSVARRDGIYDMNTIASLFTGVIGDHALISYEQPIGDRWRAWVAGGVSRYSRGLGGESLANTQRRFSARMDYKLNEHIRAGYFVRVTGFSRFAATYFSPSFYGVYGFTYDVNYPITPELSFILLGDLGWGQISRYDIPAVNVFEAFLYPALRWRFRSDLALDFGYRYGRGRSSSFGSPTYTTGALELRLQSYFGERRPSPMAYQSGSDQ